MTEEQVEIRGGLRKCSSGAWCPIGDFGAGRKTCRVHIYRAQQYGRRRRATAQASSRRRLRPSSSVRSSQPEALRILDGLQGAARAIDLRPQVLMASPADPIPDIKCVTTAIMEDGLPISVQLSHFKALALATRRAPQRNDSEELFELHSMSVHMAIFSGKIDSARHLLSSSVHIFDRNNTWAYINSGNWAMVCEQSGHPLPALMTMTRGLRRWEAAGRPHVCHLGREAPNFTLAFSACYLSSLGRAEESLRSLQLFEAAVVRHTAVPLLASAAQVGWAGLTAAVNQQYDVVRYVLSLLDLLASLQSAADGSAAASSPRATRIHRVLSCVLRYLAPAPDSPSSVVDAVDESRTFAGSSFSQTPVVAAAAATLQSQREPASKVGSSSSYSSCLPSLQPPSSRAEDQTGDNSASSSVLDTDESSDANSFGALSSRAESADTPTTPAPAAAAAAAAAAAELVGAAASCPSSGAVRHATPQVRGGMLPPVLPEHDDNNKVASPAVATAAAAAAAASSEEDDDATPTAEERQAVVSLCLEVLQRSMPDLYMPLMMQLCLRVGHPAAALEVMDIWRTKRRRDESGAALVQPEMHRLCAELGRHRKRPLSDAETLAEYATAIMLAMHTHCLPLAASSLLSLLRWLAARGALPTSPLREDPRTAVASMDRLAAQPALAAVIPALLAWLRPRVLPSALQRLRMFDPSSAAATPQQRAAVQLRWCLWDQLSPHLTAHELRSAQLWLQQVRAFLDRAVAAAAAQEPEEPAPAVSLPSFGSAGAGL